MFAYCNNNPTNLIDEKGTIPFYDDPLVKAIEDFMRWYRESDENETDENGEPTLNARFKKTVQAVQNNIGFVAGIGLGLCLEISVSEYASAKLGIQYDLARIEFIDGEFDVYQYYFLGADASILSVLADFSEEAQRSIDGSGNWEIINSDETLPLYGFGGYCYGGFTVEGYFDLIAMLEDIDEIWRN